MTSIRDLSIPQKTVTIIMIISAAALLLASGALIAYHFFAGHRDLTANATVLARIVADNTGAAVSFDDKPAAIETLNSLRAEPSIIAACIYGKDALFVEHVAAGGTPCPVQPIQKPEGRGYVLVSTPIQVQDKDIGTVQLRATLETAYAHLRQEIAITVASLVLAILFAYFLSARLHKFVTEPILSLAHTANDVSRGKDYSIRAVKQAEDELGALVDAFNEMLTQIETRDANLRDRTQELSRANRMKDEFLATLSHELRTPLTSILAWAVMMRGNLSPERRAAGMEAIERNARLQARLIDDLLDVSRIISGKFTMESSEVGLRQIIESAMDVVRPAAEAKRIHVQFQSNCDGVTVLGDASRLQQAVWNLLSNAVKFTGEHGSVKVHLETTDRHARVSISDDGIGIAPEFLPFVFDRFRQADGTSARTHGGLGIGLAIVRHIVEMHGGSVNVESEGRERGTTFSIELPLMISRAAGSTTSRKAG